MGTYMFYRLVRLPGSSSAIAAGFACGVAPCFTPFVGFQVLISFFLAWVMGGKMIAAGLGTLFGNPWTFPFIWAGIYKLGVLMGAGPENGADPSFIDLFSGLFQATITMDTAYLKNEAWPILWPMIVGSIPLTLISWFAIFFGLRHVVSNYKKKQTARLLKKSIEQPIEKKQISEPDENQDSGKLEGLT